MSGARAHAAAPLALALGLVLGAVPSHAANPARYMPPVGAPYRAEEVRVRGEGELSLGGTLTTPDNGKRRHPVVVLISDQGEQDRDGTSPGSPYRPFYEIADTLGRSGIAVLRLDDRGVGSSTGSLDSATTFDRSFDTRAALEYLRRRPDLDRLRIGLLGIGEGASIAAMIAAADTGIAALILVAAPAGDGRTLAEWRLRRAAEQATPSAARRESLFRAGMAEWKRKAAEDPWTRFHDPYDPIATAERVASPVLILQGGADEELPPDGPGKLATAFRRAGSADVTLRMLPGLSHALIDPLELSMGVEVPPAPYRVSPDVLGSISDWSVTHLPQRPDPPLAKAPAKKKRRAKR